MKYKTLLILILIFLLVLLVPVFAVGNYAVPQGDDFGFSGDVYHSVKSGGGIPDMLSSAAYRAKETYFSWQGSFSAIFLMALQPGVFGFRFYTITTYLMVLSLLGGIFLLSKRIYSGIFGMNSCVSYIVAAGISVLCTQFLPLAYQSFYWYNGSVYYTFFFSLSLFVYASALGYVQRGGAWRIIVITLLCAFIGGGNYATALVTAIVMALFIFCLLFKDNSRWKAFILPLLAACISLVISMKAPGNAAREASGASVSWIAGTFTAAGEYAFSYIRQWMNLPLAGITVFLIPLMFTECGSSSRDFRCPVLITFLSLCIFVAMFMPTVYALRQAGSSRLFNIYYFAFVIMFEFNVFYWLGWFRRKRLIDKTDRINLPVIAVSAVLGCALVLLSVIKYDTSLTSLMALGELRSGEAKGFYEEMLEREKVLEDSSVKNAVLKPLQNTPYLLFSEDMKEDKDNFMNEDAATYFGKESIIVK